MNLFNRERYFIVFYTAVDKYGRMRIGDFYLTSTGKFFSRQNVIEKIKEINNEWKYKRSQLGDANVRSVEAHTTGEEYTPYTKEEATDPKKKKAFKKLTKKRKKYGF